MNPLLFTKGARDCSKASLLELEQWQSLEKVNCSCAVDANGLLLDNLTLELRVHPPEINIDNLIDEKSTVVTIDSANRPGSLIYVVEHFTELGLRINHARISSDGGWFVDVFKLSESTGDKVRNPKKLHSIKQMLNVWMRQEEDVILNGDECDDIERIESTVFDLAGQDRAGLLAEVTHLLTHNGCNVRSAAVWTYRGRVAFVVSVTEKGRPVSDGIKLQRLKQLVTDIMAGDGEVIVDISKVRGEIHHDRRLHKLMLREERTLWEQGVRRCATLDEEGQAQLAQALQIAKQHAAAAAAMGTSRPPSRESVGSASSPSDSAHSMHGEQGILKAGASPFRSPKFDRPDIDISFCSHSKYWIVYIKCKDRTKLLFDTVCTLADMQFDIYHATIDSDQGIASQEYYIRPRTGDCIFNERSAELLKAMLESSIQRRFPKGLKVHVHSLDRFGCLAALTRVLQQAGLSITRAKVRTFATSNSSGHTFYVMDAAGGPPDRYKVEAACREIGGKLVEAGGDPSKSAQALGGSHRFSFSFLQRQWNSTWGGSPHGSSCGST